MPIPELIHQLAGEAAGEPTASALEGPLGTQRAGSATPGGPSPGSAQASGAVGTCSPAAQHLLGLQHPHRLGLGLRALLHEAPQLALVGHVGRPAHYPVSQEGGLPSAEG